MQPTIIKLELDREPSGKVPFNAKNMDVLLKYVIPIIERNRGWSTEDLTSESFKSNPEEWRVDLDATIESGLNSDVFIALVNNEPVGLLEYTKEDLKNPDNKNFGDILYDMTQDIDSKHWQRLSKFPFFKRELLFKYFSKLHDYIFSKKFYRNVGVVVKPELQGKQSGISDYLYSIMKDGFIYGWTSTPQVIRKRRKLYKHTMFFPPLSEVYKSLEDLACLTVVAARVFAKYSDELNVYDFGVSTYKEFALRNKQEYMTLSKSFLDRKKITELDYKRLDYILDFERGQGIIISVN